MIIDIVMLFLKKKLKQRGQEATCINGRKYTPGPRERADPIRVSWGREEREPEKQLAIIYIVNDEATTRRPLSPYDPVTASVIENAPCHPRSIKAIDQLLFFPRVALDLLTDAFPRQAAVIEQGFPGTMNSAFV
jgi:hypothetical protein